AENGGEMRFEGSSSNEYEVRVQSLNDTDGDSVNDEAVLEFSVDGGKSWLDETKTYTQDDLEENSKIELPHSDVTFSLNNTDTATIDDLEKGDQFNAMPKSGLYWHKSAGSEINVTPMRMENGKDNPRRIVGGSLAAEFNFRDDFAGEIRDRMNEFAKSLIWETNRVHSQGAGLSKLQEVTGTYKSENPSAAMDSEDSGLSFFDRLQDGDVSFYMYDNSTGDLVASDSVHFQSGDSMQDLVDKINNSNTSKGKLGNFMDASIENGKLQLQAEDGHSFAVGGDSSGVLSATGINTFFQGSDARDIAMNSKVNNNTDLINAAHVNGAGEVNPGDNQTAKDIAALQDTQVDFETLSEGETEQTLQDYYNGLSSDVGSKTSEAEDNKNFFKSLTEDLKSRQDSVSGVNMDEEMTNLIKFQQMYTASAKLITTTEEMMQTLMQIKR
ncbi:MAG: flagellar basal body rod C-terminal domain-containing protein, partial [Thermodesulfobacteriota bacterium]